MSRILGLYFFIFLLGPPLVLSKSTDSLGQLIQKEKDTVRAWENPEGELPSVYLMGDKDGIEVYSTKNNRGSDVVLCDDIDFDELLSISSSYQPKKTIVLNTRRPKVRDVIDRGCLIRPGDNLVAVGRGWQSYVTINDFEVRYRTPSCSNQSGYSLWARLTEPLSEDPLIYSTDLSLTEGDNQYVSLKKSTPVVVNQSLSRMLKKKVKFLDEYDVIGTECKATNCERVFLLRRNVVGLEDEGLPNDWILWEKEKELSDLRMEPVNLTSETGHLTIEGFFDFNHDQRVDLFVKGNRGACFYNLLVEGQESGFRSIYFPSFSCGCPSK